MATVSRREVDHMLTLRWLLLGCSWWFRGSCARRFLLPRCRRRSRRTVRLSRSVGANDRYYPIHLHGGAFRNFDLAQYSAGGRGNFGIYLVGGDFKQRLVALDFVTGLLQPFGDSAFKNRLPHLGHDYISWHESLPQV